MKEYKLNLSDIMSNNRYIFNSFIVISRFELTDEMLGNSIKTGISNLKSNIENVDSYRRSNHPSVNDYDNIANLLSDIDTGYRNKRIISFGDNNYYYYQMFYMSADLFKHHLTHDAIARLCCSIQDYSNSRNTSIVPDDMILYACAGNLRGKSRETITRSSIPNDVVNAICLPKNNLTINMEVDYDKKYNNPNNIIRLKVNIYENIEKAMNDINGNTYMTYQNNNMFPFFYGELRQDMQGYYKFNRIYDSKFRMKLIKDKLVFYDGQKGFHACEPYLESWDKDIITIIQFSKHRDFFYQPNLPNKSRKIVLHFVGRNRIRRASFNYNNSHAEGNVLCNVGAKRPINHNIAVGGFTEFVIPVEENGAATQPLYYVNKILNAYHNIDTISFRKYCDDYKKILIIGKTTQEDTDDILSEWFSLCTKSTKTSDDKILMAYKKMRKDLEAEYKQLGYYMSSYDFSKCMPVPKLEMDKKLKNNFYKSLHIEPINIIIDNINNKKIEPIKEIRTVAKFIYEDRGVYKTGDLPIHKFYDAKTNTVNLVYNKLRGEVARDKTQNWR